VRDDIKKLAGIYLHCETLTDIPRFGYLLSGVTSPEPVSAHSYNVSMLVLLLSDHVPGISKEKALELALVHDIPEALLTDLPLCAKEFIDKESAEKKVSGKIFGSSQKLQALFEEYIKCESLEARFVKECDRLQMLCRASRYKRMGRGDMSRFFERQNNFEFEIISEFLEAFRLLDDQSQ
jgi:putative hydrolase of HD superfamily